MVRAGQIWPLTRDHSMVQQLVDAGLLRKEEAANHPDSNKITRALGMAPEPEVDLRADIVLQQPRDLFILVSDGVTDVVTDSDLLAMALIAVDTRNVGGFCDNIVNLANARGGPDNITIQAAFVTDAGLRDNASPNRTLVDFEDPHLRATSPGMPVATAAEGGAPRTVRLAPVPPAGPPTAALPLVTPKRGAELPGRGGTLKLQLPAGTPPPPQPQAGGNTAERARPPATVIDADTEVDAPPMTSVRAAPRSRGPRIAVGLTLAMLGLALFSVGLRGLLFDDEEPTPLVEDAPAASGSTSAR